MHKTMHKTFAALFAAGALIACLPAAHAVTITHSGTLSAFGATTGQSFTPPSGFGFVIADWNFAGFNPSLGTLDSVHFQLRGTQTLRTTLSYKDALNSNGVLGGTSLLDLNLGSQSFLSGITALNVTASCVGICFQTVSITSPLAVDILGMPGTNLYNYVTANAVANPRLRASVQAKTINGVNAQFGASSLAAYSAGDLSYFVTYNYTPFAVPPSVFVPPGIFEPIGIPPPPPSPSSLPSTSASPVPEPETYALLLAGLGLLGFASRSRRRQAA